MNMMDACLTTEDTNEYDEEILTVLTHENLKSSAMLEKDKDNKITTRWRMFKVLY